MKSESRTSKTFKNAKVALCFYFINLILQFFSRKVFLDYLGIEVLGLNTTIQNLLGFLNLAELGIGSAVAYNLYKPIFEKNFIAINEIVSVQGWLYRRVAYTVIIASCVLMCFFPLIFEKANVPLWYTYGSFIVLLIGALLGYFINYRQIVLTADQREYKITLNIQGFKILKVILQILAIRLLSNGYIYWMILELLMSAVTAIALDQVLKREYPWLRTTPSLGNKLKYKYPQIILKTKQVFFHQIGSFVLGQTTPLVIYAYASLTLVAIYGNYMLIVAGVTLLVNALLNSVNAGVGNLVAEGDKKLIKTVFWELNSFRIWLASIVCFTIYYLGHSFISLWMGAEFVLEQPAFILIVIITFINLTRTSDTFLFAYGLFQDIWAPLAEALLNIGLSILLGYYWGLSGILFGVLISLLLMVCIWKPYFLYRKGFEENLTEYVVRNIKYLLILILLFIGSSFLSDILFARLGISSLWQWGKFASLFILLYSIFSLIIFSCIDCSLRNYLKRIKRFLLS